MTVLTFEQITEGFDNRLHAFIANRFEEGVIREYMEFVNDEAFAPTFEGLMDFVSYYIRINLAGFTSVNEKVIDLIETFNLDIDIYDELNKSTITWELNEFTNLDDMYANMERNDFDINSDDDFEECATYHLPSFEVTLNKQLTYLVEMSSAAVKTGDTIYDELSIYSINVNGISWEDYGMM